MPGPTGLDHLRVMERAATYSNDAVRTLHARYGEAFVFGFGPIRFHWLIGPRANRFVLADAADRFVQRRAYRFLQPIGGDHALIVSDEPEHLQRRRLVQPAFHHRHLARWQERLDARLAERFAALAGGEVVDLHGALRPTVLAAIGALLWGEGTAQREPRLLRDVGRMMAFANQPFLAQLLTLEVPGTPWWRFVRARRRVDAALYREIAARRAAPGGGDVIDLLLAARDEAGRGLDDREVRDQAVSLVSAGFDTTSAALCWAVAALLADRALLGALAEEVRGAPREAWPRLPLLDAVVRETLRLYPPASAGLRQAREAVDFAGYRLPAGARVAFSIYLTHRDPAVWDAPLAFRPQRWLDGARPNAFEYLPFGHGARYCIGGALATTVLKLGLGRLLGAYRIEAAYRGAREESGVTLRPRGGLPVRLRPRGGSV